MADGDLRYRPSPCVAAAICLLSGIWVGTLVPHAPLVYLTIAFLWSVSGAAVAKSASRSTTAFFLFATMLAAGISSWQFHQITGRQTSVREFCRDGNAFVRLRATIVTVPVVHEVPPDEFSLKRDSPPQTRFRAKTVGLIVHGNEQPCSGVCQVYVSGDAIDAVPADVAVTHGDEVSLTGRLMWPDPPGNPGEFDFPKYLTQQRISAQLFVVDPAAIEIIVKAGWWNPRRWISFLRHDARRVIVNNVHPQVQAIALALLLGNRHQLPTELEQSFVASGTMHLLAISGLHVGILCLFLLRTANLLLVPRRAALMITVAICVTYAMVTDLRPSVVRATVFIVMFTIGELSGRKTSIVDLLAVTAVVMLMVDPNLAFDRGASLSFMAVAALGRASSGNIQEEEDREAPPDAVTEWERLRQTFSEGQGKLMFRYKQTLYVLVATAPLVAATFHVVSPVGLLVNVLLIPIMFLCLWAGFVTLLIGLLIPPAAWLPAEIFSWSLRTMMGAVKWSASVPGGHLYVPDVPDWFLPTYYLLLLTLLFTCSPKAAWTLRTCLLMCVSAAFYSCSSPAAPDGMRVTVLDIGHGSAAVIEVDGKVLLVDAGALSRSDRTADVVCRFLWNRGYHKVNGILISHADMDHYNAVPGIMDRMAIAEIVTSTDFLRSSAPSVQSVLRMARDKRIPISLAFDGDSCALGNVELRVLQVDVGQLPAVTSDNEKSLVLSITYAGRHIILPGDIEGAGLDQLLSKLGTADLLVSPHHGSTKSNPPELAEAVHPSSVAASSQNALSRPFLENTYANSHSVKYTCDVGAITAMISSSGEFHVTSHRCSAGP